MAPKSKTGDEYRPPSSKSLSTLYQAIVEDYERAGVLQRIPKKVVIKRKLCALIGDHNLLEPMYISPVGDFVKNVSTISEKAEIGSDDEVDGDTGEAAVEEVSEETRQQRCAKRRHAIATIKASAEYQ